MELNQALKQHIAIYGVPISDVISADVAFSAVEKHNDEL